MARLAVVIGVDVVRGLNGLAPLNAAKDAKNIAEWFKGEGFDVLPFIDDSKAADEPKVTVAKIARDIRIQVDKGDLTQIVVYFSGHGIFNGVDVWLLGDAGHSPGEAINVGASDICAKALGVEHVVFIGDACRTVPPNVSVQAITGQSIFPPPRAGPWKTKVDQFLAVSPSYTAIESLGLPADAQYHGLFTQGLTDCFQDTPGGFVLNIQGLNDPVLPNRKLEQLLPDKVFAAYRKRGLATAREPYTQVPSPDTAWMARAKVAPALANIQAGTAGVVLQGHVDGDWDPAWDQFAGPTAAPEEDVRLRQTPATERLRAAANSTRALNFEFETAASAHSYKRGGLITLGARVAQARVLARRNGGLEWIRTLDPIKDGLGPWLDLGDLAPCDVLLSFEGGGGALVGLYPRYTAIVGLDTVKTDEGMTTCIGSLSYRHESALIDDYMRAQTAQLRAMKEEAGQLLLEGRLKIAPEEAAELAHHIRQFKKSDPTLGVLAAYAYAAAGADDEITSVEKYVYDDLGGSIPADLILLRSPRAGEDWQVACPGLPMLTRGWHLLNLMGAPPIYAGVELSALRTRLAPTPWTSFTSAGMQLFDPKP